MNEMRPIQRPQPVYAAAPVQQTVASTPTTPALKKSSSIGLILAYILILVVGIGAVYAVLNAQLESTQHDLTNAQAQVKDLQSKSEETTGIATGGYQGVFMDGGQVYFGKLASQNNQYFVLTDVYYLQGTGGTQSLVKLGCENHGPEDKMTINRDQVQFWENLKNDSKVAKAIDDFQTKNPNGQKCA